MTGHETPDELRARAERSTTALRQAPAVGPLETIMMTPESANGLADLIDALLARLTEGEEWIETATCGWCERPVAMDDAERRYQLGQVE